MGKPISINALESLIGLEIGVSEWVEISQERINAFADVTEDWQAIHLDPAAAQSAGFEGTLAHGFLTLSLLSSMAYSALPTLEGQSGSINYGFDRVRFLAPVSAGARLRARFTLTALERRSDDAVLMSTQAGLEIEGVGKPALIADWRILFLCAADPLVSG